MREVLIMKLDYKKTFAIGLGFFTVSIVWSIYNVAVPIYLDELGLKGLTVGAIMTIDNIFAIIFLPLFGILSDKTNTRYGKRMPYLLVGIPLSAIAFFLIPFSKSSLLLIMLTVISLNFFMSIYRAPTVALMPDFTPPPLRSKANGIINFMGGLGASFAYLLGGVLFKINEYYSFAAGSSILIITIILMYGFIREPKEVSWENQEKTQNVSGERLNERDKGETVSLIFLLLAIFFWFTGFNAMLFSPDFITIFRNTLLYMNGDFKFFNKIFPRNLVVFALYNSCQWSIPSLPI
jgi:maltose/moltooligosaccharide transporter